MKNADHWNAEKYKENSDPQYRCALDAINRIAFVGNERVLDLGCGDGRISSHISACLPDGFVLGIDASSNMISACQRSYRHIPNLKFQRANITGFNTIMKFDYVVSFSAFHWISNQLTALRKIYEALEPGGTLIVRMGSQDQPRIAEVFNKDCWKKQLPVRESRFHGKSGEAFSQLLDQCRYENIQLEILSLSRFFPNTDELFKWVMAWAPHATGLSGEKVLEFGKDIVNSICHGQDRGRGDIELKTQVLAVSAKRPVQRDDLR